MIRVSKNFTANEFYCPCLDCRRKGQRMLIDQDVVELLQDIRDEIDEPLHVAKGGGVRCRHYQKSIGGYSHSYHLQGLAADVFMKNQIIEDMIMLAIMGKRFGFTRIGLYPYTYSKFVHFDLGKVVQSESWIRDRSGIYHYYDTLEDAIGVIQREGVK
jgi:uncharacterized protein YcbK (DUF882 family)